jgi:hypothetical protein
MGPDCMQALTQPILYVSERMHRVKHFWCFIQEAAGGLQAVLPLQHMCTLKTGPPSPAEISMSHVWPNTSLLAR